jgi:hypothetical protein
LAGKYDISNPDAPINLIHLDDCIGMISAIIENEYWGKIVNGVTPFHPARREYYSKKAAELQLPALQFSTGSSIGKKVVSQVLGSSLKYRFAKPLL